MTLYPAWRHPRPMDLHGKRLFITGASRGIGLAAELADAGVAVNGLWPQTVIATAALAMIPQVRPENCRKPAIVADAAHAILSRPSRAATGQFFIDPLISAPLRLCARYPAGDGGAPLTHSAPFRYKRPPVSS